MPSYHRFTDEQIERAGNIDLVAYAGSQGYELAPLGHDYKIPGLNGMVIKSDRKTWYNFTHDKGGGPIQFVMLVKGKAWADAVSELLHEPPPSQARPMSPAPKPPIELKLPERAADLRRLFAYLCKTRGLDQKIVYEFVHRRRLYQDTRGNCVFVTYEGDKPIYASLRSTLTDSTFRGDVAGSRKVGWGCGWKSNDTLCVFESPIDLMSYMTIRKQLHGSAEGLNYMSLGGTNLSPLTRCLQKNPFIRQVFICTDNDEAGELFYTLNKPKLEALGVTVHRGRPKNKDWNEDLCTASERAEEWVP